MKPGARHTAEAHSVEQVSRLGVATILATDAEVKPAMCHQTRPWGNRNRITDSLATERLERWQLEYPILELGTEERRFRIIA